MVTFRDIIEANFDDCIRLEVEPYQKSFVASNLYSLAQAWLYPNCARPYAIFHDETMVGFIMLDNDYQKDGLQKVYEIWRIMIDKKYQGKGFGRAAMDTALRRIKENPKVETVRLSFEPNNAVAE